MEMRRKEIQAPLGRVMLMLESLTCFAAPTVQEIYWCGRATLCSSKNDFPAYDECFLAMFGDTTPMSPRERARDPRVGEASPAPSAGRTEQTEEGALAQVDSSRRRVDISARDTGTHANDFENTNLERVGSAGACSADVLRHRDVAALSEAERRNLFELVEKFVPEAPARASRRLCSDWRGSVDVRRTVRSALSRDGDPERIYRVSPKQRRRRRVLLIDVSGSMARYSEVFLRLGHVLVAAYPRTTEIFTLGTRLTHITRPMREVPVEAALTRVSSAIPDWQGGTRLGDQLKAFLDSWGQRGMARGADIVIASDGLECGDCTLLFEQMERLRRLAHRIVWCNPHKSTLDYEPISRGMRAVLPHVHEFLAGRTLAEIEDLGNAVIGK